MQPKGMLLDYGGTLVEELGYDERAGNEWLLRHAVAVPPDISLDDVLSHVDRTTRELGGETNDRAVEVPWQTLSRLVYDSLAIRFDVPFSDLELGYWLATAKTRRMAGATETLEAWHVRRIPMAVVSNCRFSERVLRHELERHGLAKHLEFIMVSAEYGARKPSATFLGAAAQRLAVAACDIWFIGDSLEKDMAGAKAAGMKTLWLRRDASPIRPATVDRSCSNWSEVASYFG